MAGARDRVRFGTAPTRSRSPTPGPQRDRRDATTVGTTPKEEPLKKIRDVKGVKDLGEWLKDSGLTPGENRFFGTVHPVHSETSMHYKEVKNGAVVAAANKQGTLAIDLNDIDVKDDIKRGKAADFGSETDALNYVYTRIHTISEQEGWPLNEMFFNGRGFIKEKGFKANHAIGGHDTHLHVAFDAETW